jgi:NADH:ubiquinone oxidoreductase subunit E
MGKPTREPTHATLDFGRMMSLAGQVEDAMDDLGISELAPASVEEIADEIGTRESYVYAALATTGSSISQVSADPIQVRVCLGDCQRWGAVAVMDRLITLHGKRRRDGDPTFGLAAVNCLDHCAYAAAVEVRTPDGVAVVPAATPESMDEAIAELFASAESPDSP